MSLSVEHIKQVLSGFESCDLAIFDDAVTPCRGADRIVIDALRELQALKEAKPVGYAWDGYLDGSYTEFPCIQEQEPNTVPLIRKPE